MSHSTTDTTLIIGYGNPGRLDDGLGPALAAKLEARQLPGVTVDADYQLTVEDAAAVAKHDVVIFVDASVSAEAPYTFTPVEPWYGDISFSSHSVEPEAVLGMAHNLFGASTRGFALAIRGYDYNEFGERLSEQANANLEDAARFIVDLLEHGELANMAGIAPVADVAAMA